MSVFTQVILFTDTDGRAKFREEAVPLGEDSPQAMLSALFPSDGFQLRHSPVGFRNQFHFPPYTQWAVILGGEMEIGLQDETSRIFRPGPAFLFGRPAARGCHLRRGRTRPLEPPGGSGPAGHAVCAWLRDGRP